MASFPSQTQSVCVAPVKFLVRKENSSFLVKEPDSSAFGDPRDIFLCRT